MESAVPGATGGGADCGLRIAAILSVFAAMSFVRPLAVALVAAGLLASCGTGGEGEVAAEPAPQEGFQMKSGELFDDDSQKIMDRYGSANPMYDKSGQRKGARENSMVSNHFDKGYGAQSYNGDVSRYEKRSFWGKKDYTSQVYGGDTDGGRFLQSAREGAVSAREGTRMSRENSMAMDTGTVGSPSAREMSRRTISKPSDAETDYRRSVYQQPEIKDLRKKRALDVDDTRAMLGR